MTTPFTVIPVTAIDDSNFVSSTVAEDDHAEWSDASVSYVAGDRVIVIADHMIYEAAQDHTSDSGKAPDPDADTAYWLRAGPTSRWAPFDQAEGTVCTDASDITFVIDGDDVTGMHFRALVGESVRIQAENAGGGYYDQTYELNDTAICDDWWDYFFAPFRFQRDLTVLDIPPKTGSTYTITIATRGGTAAIGTFAMGNYVQYGFTQYNARITSVRFGKTNTDAYGTTTLRPGGGAFRMTVNIVAQKAIVDQVAYDLLDLADTAAVWVGAAENYRSLTIYGFYNDWDIDIDNPSFSYATLQIQGFT